MNCIYCRKTKAPNDSSVEHVIPSSFGTFSTQTPTLASVCTTCNAYFAKHLDEALSRETLEGLERYKQGMLSSEARPQKQLEIRLPMGMGDLGGAYAWVNGMTNQLMPVRAQVRFQDADGNPHFVLRKDLRALDWKSKGFSSDNLKVIVPDEKSLHEVLADLEAIGIKYDPVKMKPKPPSADVPESITVQITGTNQVSDRAMLKVLINFAAYYLGENEVRKDEWDTVKQYVLHAERARLKTRISDGPFWGGEKKALRLPNTSYNLRIKNDGANVVGALQFFNLFLHEFILVENYSIPETIEMRFTPGRLPAESSRIHYSIMVPHRLNFEYEKLSGENLGDDA